MNLMYTTNPFVYILFMFQIHTYMMVAEYAEICNDNKCNFYFIFILFHKYPIKFPFKRMYSTLSIV